MSLRRDSKSEGPNSTDTGGFAAGSPLGAGGSQGLYPGWPGQGAARRPRAVPPKLYRVTELAEYSGVSRQTIHNYTTMGLLRESKWTNGGHRLFDESAFARLDAIAEMKSQQKPLEYIRRHFARLEP